MENTQEVGFVKFVRNFLVYLDGLPNIKINELVESDNGVRGWVNALMHDRVEVLMLDDEPITFGQMFKKAGKSLNLEVGNFLLGRTINPLGIPIDGNGLLSKTKNLDRRELDGGAWGIDKRRFIEDQFITGIGIVDSLVPLGKGQRQLVLGDGHAGKTEFLIDIIANQKNTGVICIYALIGKPVTEVKDIISKLEQTEAISHTVIIAASSSDIAPLIFLTPHAALTVAEFFQRQGKDVLVILDDLGNHAKIYREMALLSNKSPGRESYPGDIFYQHAHLMERAGNFNEKVGSGSITLLPVTEININDFATYIPTNIVSMTDGHFLFKASLFNQGQRPAIDIPGSVSRVGRQTQQRIQNMLATRVKQVLSQAASVETLSRFSAELPAETQLVLRRKDILYELLKQDRLTNYSRELQTVLLSLVFTNFLPAKGVEFVKKNKLTILNYFTNNKTGILLVQQVFKQPLDDLIKSLDGVSPDLDKLCQP